MDKKLLGRLGERLAKNFLEKNGFEILEKNYFVGKLGEIDLIAKKNNLLHFIEVKTRTNKNFGWPEESVGKTKLEKIILCAHEYLSENQLNNLWEIDVIAISINFQKRQANLRFIKNVSIDK